MSGGSGLLDQMVQRWDEVLDAARRITADCPSQCDAACVDCLLHYRNAWSQAHLDRNVVWKCIDSRGRTLQFAHEIPPCLPRADETEKFPVNEAEAALLEMLERAGFPAPFCQHEIDLGKPVGKTIPDFFFEDPTDRFEGLCIYLDGLSRAIHGNPETRSRDAGIREELRARDYEVLAIAASHLTDRDEMARHFSFIARFLIGKDKARDVRDDTSWFFDFTDSSQSTP